MKSPGKIIQTNYNPQTLDLRVSFDTRRVIVFQQVPPVVGQTLHDRDTRDGVLARHVLGKFGWRELGMSTYP